MMKRRELRDGDIIKRNLTSRESWTVVERDGYLWGIPNNNRFFTDTREIALCGDQTEPQLIIANVIGIDFSRTGSKWNQK